MAHIYILGTSHIAKESVSSVKKAIDSFSPTIIALELDKDRLLGLLHPEQKKPPSLAIMREVGVKGWIFLALGSIFEKKLGKVVGVSPGTEMLHAALLAKEKKIPLALIDRHIKHTLRRLSLEITWKEKWTFVSDVIRGIFGKGAIPFDLEKVPPQELIEKLLVELKPRYPSLYRVLVEERNSVMALRLKRLAASHPDATILAVVGAGHAKGLQELLGSK